MKLTLIKPDDFHHHLRDGDSLQHVVTFAAASFGRVVAMPNLKPPVKNVHDAIRYREEILSCLDPSTTFNALMTLYLTDSTAPVDIFAAKESGIVYAAKLYPSGATTNSEFGVTSISRIEATLQAMSDVGMPLLVHGEVVDSSVDIFDREKVFIERILMPLIAKFPYLKVVMEHITTSEAVEFVTNCGTQVAATITPHHLLYNRNELFKGGICPHMYCLPVLKREQHRLALLNAATSGNPKFFIGTDSAPHSVSAKESSCGCAGIFSGHAPIELYCEAFERADALDKLEGFTSVYGQQYYGLPLNSEKITLIKEDWKVPQTLTLGNTVMRPLRAGEVIHWKKL